MDTKKKPLVVLFGRTNVGKSTLFNCLVKKGGALVSTIEGTTRDCNEGVVEWQGREFNLIDTGGIIDTKQLNLTKKEQKRIKATDNVNLKVQQQSKNFLNTADLILFMVDTRTGLLGDDKKMALELKKILPTTDHIVLVANKTDSPNLHKEVPEFNKLSLGVPIAISATTSSGTGDLLDLIVKKLKIRKKRTTTIETKDEAVNVCIIGKPNVGKSTLVNQIIDRFGDGLDTQKMITSPVAHTTREPKDTRINFKKHVINFIDTAGISKKEKKQARRGKLNNTLEKFSIEKSIKILNKADVALLMIDVYEGITIQESKILDEIIKKQVSLILIANKWDLVEERDTKAFTQEIFRRLPYIRWAPLQFISALTGEKVEKIMDLVLELAVCRKRVINESYLTKFLLKIVKKHPPIRQKGINNPYIYKLKQVHANPPKFDVVIGIHDTISHSYLRYIENNLRKTFDITGTPISVTFSHKRKIHGKNLEEENKGKKVVNVQRN